MIYGAGGEHSAALEPRGGSASGFCRPLFGGGRPAPALVQAALL